MFDIVARPPRWGEGIFLVDGGGGPGFCIDGRGETGVSYHLTCMFACMYYASFCLPFCLSVSSVHFFFFLFAFVFPGRGCVRDRRGRGRPDQLRDVFFLRRFEVQFRLFFFVLGVVLFCCSFFL